MCLHWNLRPGLPRHTTAAAAEQNRFRQTNKQMRTHTNTQEVAERPPVVAPPSPPFKGCPSRTERRHNPRPSLKCDTPRRGFGSATSEWQLQPPRRPGGGGEAPGGPCHRRIARLRRTQGREEGKGGCSTRFQPQVLFFPLLLHLEIQRALLQLPQTFTSFCKAE